jgi:hypothetical protein
VAFRYPCRQIGTEDGAANDIREEKMPASAGVRALSHDDATGIVRGLPHLLLRTEGAALFALAFVLYWQFGASWILFVVLLLAPDVGMLGYINGNRVGAVVYDMFHTYLPPAVLAIVGILTEARFFYPLGLVWFAHIGMDRALGYGLKYPTGFRHTHLGWIGGRT